MFYLSLCFHLFRLTEDRAKRLLSAFEHQQVARESIAIWPHEIVAVPADDKDAFFEILSSICEDEQPSGKVDGVRKHFKAVLSSWHEWRKTIKEDVRMS